MPSWARTVGPAVAAALLLIGGAVRVRQETGEGVGLLLLGAMVLGVAVAIVVSDHERDRNNDKRRDDDGPA